MFGKQSRQELSFEDQIFSSFRNRPPAARLVLFLLVDILGLMLGRLYQRSILLWEPGKNTMGVVYESPLLGFDPAVFQSLHKTPCKVAEKKSVSISIHVKNASIIR